MIVVSVASFVFGTIIGSFLNVVVLRRGAKALSGRSACFSCGARIKSYDLIPVVSWIALRGRCRSCGSKISLQYPLVEGTTGLLFAILAYSNLLPLSLALGFCIAAIMVAIAAYDLKHTIIPDTWVAIFALLALGYTLSLETGMPWTWIALAPVVSALPLFVLWLVSRGTWMGFGDVKLALGIGFLLGPLHGPYTIMLSFIIGAIISLPLVFFTSESGKRLLRALTPTRWSENEGSGFTMKSEVPFGPFLILSTVIVWFALLFGIPLPVVDAL